MSKINELRQLIRTMIMKEISTTGGSGIAGSPGAMIQTPNAFTGGTARGERKRKKIATSVGMKLMEHRQRVFEDIINKADFELNMSDQAKDLMDYIHGNEKFEDDLQDINDLFQKMQTDGVFTKQEAFKVYKEFVERAAREFVRENPHAQNMKMDEYFLTKDLLDVIYYHLSKMEMPMIDTPSAVDKAPETGAAPEAGTPPEGGAAPEAGTPPAGAPPAGAPSPEAGAEAGGEEGGEAPPEGEEAPEGAPKPEEVTELKNMIREIYEELNVKNVKLDELEELRQQVKIIATKYAQSGETELARELVKVMNYLDGLTDKFALGEQ